MKEQKKFKKVVERDNELDGIIFCGAGLISFVIQLGVIMWLESEVLDKIIFKVILSDLVIATVVFGVYYFTTRRVYWVEEKCR